MSTNCDHHRRNRGGTRRVWTVGLSVCALWACGGGAAADTPAPTAAPAVSTPPAALDTPAGRALAKVLARLDDPKAVLKAEDFSPEFIRSVPLDRVVSLLDSIRSAEDRFALVSVEDGATPTGLAARVRGAKSGKPFRIMVATDDAGVMTGLRLAPAPDVDAPPVESWAQVDERLAAIAPRVGLAVWELGARKDGEKDGKPELTPVHRLNADVPLAVGSTFKLYVLGALVEKMRSDGVSFDTPLAIRDEHKSLPSGVMQDLPPGTERTIGEFAKQMISISDNTATDHLMALVGREAVERFFLRRVGDSGKTLPFLTTREMFRIKLGGDRTLPARYAAASVEERRASLVKREGAGGGGEGQPGLKPGEVAASEPSLLLAAAWRVPVEIDSVEWFVSTDDACRVMAELVGLARTKDANVDLGVLTGVLGTNPGLPLDRARWKLLGYKGGSEPGVLNMTWALQRTDGRIFLLSLTANDPKRALSEEKVFGLASRTIEFLGRQP